MQGMVWIVGILFLLSSVQASVTVFVNASSVDNDPATCGSNWTSACRSLSAGVEVACQSNDEAWLYAASGTYEVTETINVTCPLHISSNQSVILLDNALRSPIVFHGTEQQSVWNASLSGFAFSFSSSQQEAVNVTCITVSGSFHDFYLSDLAWQNSSLLSAVDVSGSVTNLYLTGLSIEDSSFARPAVVVKDCDQVFIEGWNWSGLELNSVSSSDGAGVHLSANSSIQIANMLWSNISTSTTSRTQLGRMSSPLVEMRNVTLSAVLLSSGFQWDIVDTAIDTVVSLDNFSITQSLFSDHILTFASTNGSTSQGALQVNATGCSFQSTTAYGDWWHLEKGQSSVSLLWERVSWSGGSMREVIGIDEEAEQMDIQWNSVSIEACQVEAIVNISPQNHVNWTSRDVRLQQLTPTNPAHPLIDSAGQQLITMEGLQVTDITNTNATFIRASNMTNVTLVSSRFDNNTCHIMLEILQGSTLHASNLTMSNNNFYFGLSATMSHVSIDHARAFHLDGSLRSLATLSNCTFWFNDTRAYENVSFDRILNFYNSTGLITHGYFGVNVAKNGAILANYGNLTVTNSAFGANSADTNSGMGGAICSQNNNLIVDKCHFKFNLAYSAGAIYFYNGSMLLRDSFFESNQAFASGGAIYIDQYADVSIVGTEFLRNQAPSGSGGAIFCTTGPLEVVDSQFEGCDANLGGAIFTTSQRCSITNTTFQDNHAYESGGDIFGEWGTRILFSNSSCTTSSSAKDGGSIYLDGSHLEISSSNFTLVHAQTGGAICSSSSTVSIQGAMFAGCFAADKGGAIQSSDLTLSIDNSTFQGCRGVSGGAIEAEWGIITISSSILTDNIAQKGGALYLTGAVGQSVGDYLVSLPSCSFYNNSANFGGAIFLTSEPPSVGIEQSVLEGNKAVNLGGAIYAEGQANITVANSTLQYNKATSEQSYGGAIYLRSKFTATLLGVKLLNNTAKYGGAVAGNAQLSGALVTVDASELRGNSAFQGCAIHLLGSVQCVLHNSTCSNFGADGGGCAYAAGKAKMLIEDSQLVNNFAHHGGAILLEESAQLAGTNVQYISNVAYYGAAVHASEVSTIVLDYCSFTNNTAQEGGGGLLTSNSLALVANTSFVGNMARYGGGTFINSLTGIVKFANCTWTQNYANEIGGALFVSRYNELTNTLHDSVFRNNFAEHGGCNVGCEDTVVKNVQNMTICSGCDYGSPPANYSGYQNEEQFASWPIALVMSGCSQTIPLDVPQAHISASLQDGFGTTVKGPYLTDHPYLVQSAWSNGVSPSTIEPAEIPETGTLTFPELTLCGNNFQQFLLQSNASSSVEPGLSALCIVGLNGCSRSHHSPRAGTPCGYCRLDTYIIIPLFLLGLLIVTVILVLCCVIVVCTRRLVTRYRLRSMQVPDLSRDGYTLEDLLADSSITRIPWSDVEFGSVLGKGASGLVRKTTWKRGHTRQEIATKELLMAECQFDQELVAEFCKEIKYMSSLHHPNVVGVVGVIVSPDQMNIYLASELMSRGSLADLIMTKGTNIPLSLRFRIAIDAAEGMAFIHSKNVIHRDLKSHNLLINAEWKTKIADFGISTINPTITRRMTCIGTPIYMAPEVLQKDAYSTRADVYSFGVVMCELFTNQRPYSQPPYDTMGMGMLAHHITEENARPSLEGLHPTLANLIEECWAASPHSRPSFGEVTTRLKRLSSDLGGDLRGAGEDGGDLETTESLSHSESDRTSTSIQ